MHLAEPRRSFSHRLFLALMLTGCAGLTGVPAPQADPAGPPGEPFPPLTFGPKCEKGEVLNDTGRVEVAGVRITARPLAAADWEGWLEERAAGMGHMLRPHDGSPPPFQVFLLSLENLSGQRVRFQPGNVVRLFDQPDLQDHARDYTDLYRFLMHENKNPEALAGIRDAFYDSAVILEPGESVSRLLFFNPLPVKKWKSVSILLSHFQVGTETLTAAIPFHLEKKNLPKKKGD